MSERERELSHYCTNIPQLDKIYLPVFKSWRLNERHYGALQGLSKPGLTAELGEEVVQQYRGGLHSRPPPMSPAQQLQQVSERAKLLAK